MSNLNNAFFKKPSMFIQMWKRVMKYCSIIQINTTLVPHYLPIYLIQGNCFQTVVVVFYLFHIMVIFVFVHKVSPPYPVIIALS